MIACDEGDREMAAGPPRSSEGGCRKPPSYGMLGREGGRISAAGGKFWAKIRILWGIANPERANPPRIPPRIPPKTDPNQAEL